MYSALKTALSAVLLAAAILPARAALASTAEDTVDVRRLMEAYHRAVVSHDGARLQALFVPQGSAWFKVLSDEAYARMSAKTPGVAKALPGDVQSFAAYVSTTRSSLDPQHGHVRIQSDGTIASVYFDFRFLVDGKEENRGSESWQLVKGADGWRIVSIVYSSTPPA